jgi:hypothetical protein
MATTYKLIDKAILTGSQASVSFTGLGSYSSTYTDLKVVTSTRSATTNSAIYIKFNGSSSNYSMKSLFTFCTAPFANGASGSEAYIGNWTAVASNQTSNTFGSQDWYIPNFSSSNYKSISVDGVQENNATFSILMMNAGLWSDTSAITSMAFTLEGGDSFASGSSFYLYGIKNS